jgi:hypothetical protein
LTIAAQAMNSAGDAAIRKAAARCCPSTRGLSDAGTIATGRSSSRASASIVHWLMPRDTSQGAGGNGGRLSPKVEASRIRWAPLM